MLLLCLGSWAAWKAPLGLAGNRAPAERERAFGLTLESTVQGTCRGGCPPLYPRQSRGSPEAPLQTTEVDFSKCAKASVPSRQLLFALLSKAPCWEGRRGEGGLSLFKKICRIKKHVEGFAIAFPAPLSGALVLSVCHLSFIFWPGWACVCNRARRKGRGVEGALGGLGVRIGQAGVQGTATLREHGTKANPDLAHFISETHA